MRVGIDFSFLSLGPHALKRGICRYTLRQLREVLHRDLRHEYLLLCEPGADRSLIPHEIRAAPNVFICPGPARGIVAGVDRNAPQVLLRLAADHQDWVRSLGIDLYHSTTPLLFEQPVFAHWDACPMVASFYDTIPLLYPDHYLPEAGAREAYARGMQFLRDAERIIAISESARTEAALQLGIPKHRIDVAHPVAEQCFRPLPQETFEPLLRGLRERARLPLRFALAVMAVHHSKNLDTLFRAYARLDPVLRERLPLVICCDLQPREAARLNFLAEACGVKDDVVATGFVDDDELAALYNAALMVLHPSRHEGFGLPVLEAMRCGRPVIASRAGALPEVGGEAVLQAGPEDPEAWARAIEELYQDPARRRTLGEQGRSRAEAFSARALAEATLASYERAAAGSPPRARAKRRVAVWTPFPPQPSGVADYSLELLEELRPECDLEVFVDDGVLPPPALLARHRVHHFRAFPRRQAQAPFDAIVYQLGTSPFHLFMQDALHTWPGIVVLHDLAWSYIRHWHHLQRGDEPGFEGELLALEGEEARREYRAIREGRASARPFHAFLDDHPMLGEVIARSQAQIVLLDVVARDLNRRYGAHPHVVPMGVGDPYRGRPALECSLARERLGIGPATFVVGALGLLATTKRLASGLHAFHRLLEGQGDALLALVGPSLDPAYQRELEDLGAKLGLGSRLRITGGVPSPAFRDYLLSCDVVLGLRHPAKKEMSASVMRAIAAGKPALVSDIPEWSHLPREFCWRVPTGGEEVEVLSAALRVLATDSPLRAWMGKRARAHFEEQGTVEHMAKGYLRVMDSLGTPAALTA